MIMVGVNALKNEIRKPRVHVDLPNALMLLPYSIAWINEHHQLFVPIIARGQVDVVVLHYIVDGVVSGASIS